MNLNEAKVTGVLNRNSGIRDEHLKRNYGKYFQYTNDLSPAIGEAINIDFSRPLYDLTNSQPLLDYTHNPNELYGAMINSIYFNKDREKEIVNIENPAPEQVQSWAGKYVDYITYLDEVLGEDVYSRHVRYINDFLSGQYIENALRQTEVGVIENINVPIAKQGIITTNPNNLQGVDTPLGTITNYMYSTLLYNGAIFNSDRKSEVKYITPSLVNQYGNNLSNVSELGDMLRVGTGDYELREDLGADAHIIHSFKDAVGDLNVNWMTKNIENAKKYLSENNPDFLGYELGKDGYVEIVDSQDKRRIFFTNKWFDGTNSTIMDDVQNRYDNTQKVKDRMTYLTYDETDVTDGNLSSNNGVNNESNSFDYFVPSIDANEVDGSLLSKTNKLFSEHKINTLIGRFHTSLNDENPAINDKKEFIDTAKTKFGNSHGRNLLTKKAQDSEVADADDTNGYDNPYCRTWTYHHQYNQVKKLIRPFMNPADENGVESPMTIKEIQNRNARFRNRIVTEDHGDISYKVIGPNYLASNTVLDNNGFVNITPKEATEGDNGTRISRCMFSLENLAWKDVPKGVKENYFSSEQTGPNGGRIMWFPPYDLSFSENVNVAWNESSFIGRGEKVYTYTNTDRTGTLSFTLLIDHPAIVNSFSKLDDGDISSDIDSDILRYFAGCDIPNIDIPDSDEDGNGGWKDEGEEKIDKEGEIKFYVYFPNNFSGMVTPKKDKISENVDVKEYYKDWWSYILAGCDCQLMPTPNQFGEGKSAWIGYETTQNTGISKLYNDTKIDEEIKNTWIGVSQCWWDNPKGEKCLSNTTSYYEDDAKSVNKEDGSYCYRYRVDKDLRQKLTGSKDNPGQPLNPSYNDKTSSQLNTKLNQESKGAEYTFGDVISALIDAKQIKKEGGIIQDLSLLSDFLKKNGCSQDNINKLGAIFSADGLEITKIKIVGSADKNDASNSAMLAARRATAIKLLLKDSTNLLANSDQENLFDLVSSRSEKKSKEDAGAIENKLERNVFVTIKYKLPGEIQAWSSMSEQATNPVADELAAEQEDQDNFNKWYELLLTNANIIKEYDTIFDNEDFETRYNLFDEEIKQWCNGGGTGSGATVDYNEDWSSKSPEEWNNSVVDPLVEKYGYKYFVPAIKMSMSDNNLNEDFIEQYTKHISGSYNKEKQEKLDSLSGDVKTVNEKYEKLEEEETKLTKKLEKLEDKKIELEGNDGKGGKIGECDENIKKYINESGEYPDSGTTQYASRIEEIDYQLSHWTTQFGEKSKLVIEKNNCKTKKSELERKIENENKKKSNYESDLEEVEKDIKDLEAKIEQVADSKENIVENILPELQEEIESVNNDSALSLDLTKTELYFQKMSENERFSLDQYAAISSLYWLYETGSTFTNSDWNNKFPYKKYSGEALDCPEEISENTVISYNQLLVNYFILDRMIKDIDKGFEYACDQLFGNDEDYNNLMDLLYLNYLLSTAKIPTQESDWRHFNDDESGVSCYDVWNFIVGFNNKPAYNFSIDYEPFKDAIRIVGNDINSYEHPESTPEPVSFNKMISTIKEYTSDLLKYCETVTNDLMAELKEAAKDGYDNAKKAADDAARDAASQKLQKQYEAECITKDNIAKDVEKKRDQYLMRIFAGGKNTRYENEAEYFTRIKTDDPLIFKSIKDKFKYFNPAFHSMSPEGFNARLNFLHQCTRQGHTYEPSTNTGVKTANNLAFGRMPICVLRIGDFINTRIIINNININYDNGGMQWDLNPEGVGVQPMYAKVNLGITIIGGQSLAGPINRLQNAVSFDYYANTGVYDDRADMIKVDDNGKMIGYDKIWSVKPKDDNDTAGSFVDTTSQDYIDRAKKAKEDFKNARKAQDEFKSSKDNEC